MCVTISQIALKLTGWKNECRTNVIIIPRLVNAGKFCIQQLINFERNASLSFYQTGLRFFSEEPTRNMSASSFIQSAEGSCQWETTKYIYLREL